jgi:hypothetical protein
MATPSLSEHPRPDPSSGATRETAWHTYHTPTAPVTASPGYSKEEAFTQSRFHLRKWYPASGSLKTNNPLTVYKILCSCGKVYISQTGCCISTRISEYIRGTRQVNQ